jgi:hypothetical protein
MALKWNEKIERVTRFLISFSDRRVMSKMRLSGFSPDELARGWALAQQAASPWLEASAKQPDTHEIRDALAHLDDWENRHFPVIEATLRHRYPSVHREVIGKLSQTSGPALLITIPKLLDNLTALGAAQDSSHREARQLLATRGISDEVIAQAAGWVKKASAADLSTAPVSDEELERRRSERDQQVEVMWNWYTEWSAIARARIDNKNLLRQMGFGRPGRPSTSIEQDDEPSQPPAAKEPTS